MPEMGVEKVARIRVMTTTERDTLEAVEGMVIFNSTTDQLEEYDGTQWQAAGQVILTTHEADTSTHGAADLSILDDDALLAILMRRGHFLHVPTNTGWTASVANNGSNDPDPTYAFVMTSTSANSSSVLYAYLAGFGVGETDQFRLDWDKVLHFRFWFAARDVSGDHTNSVYRLQLKEAITEGALAAKGVGIRIDGVAGAPQDLYFETYGTQLKATDTEVNITSDGVYWIDIIHEPGAAAYLYVNGVLKATHDTAADIPSGESGSSEALTQSAINGASAGSGRLYIGSITLWQEI